MTANTTDLAELSTDATETVLDGAQDQPTDGSGAKLEEPPERANAAGAVDDETADPEASEAPDVGDESSIASGKRHIRWGRMLAYGALPTLALVLAIGVGYTKWLDSSARESRMAATESVRVATDDMVALLSYKPDTVDRDLGAARDRLTGDFKNSYAGLIHDVVIPGSKQKQISALANVPAAASVSASPNHAVVLVFVNQTVTVGNDPPANTASSVQVTLEKVGGRWLISQFEPV
jgi:Mce-associated membrane protein